ncbi:MAG: acetyltransferase [Candidatus Methanomethylicaceae archaeon]
MYKVIIIGAGGHGQIVADILLQDYNRGGTYKPIGFLDDDKNLIGKIILGLQVFGSISKLYKFNHDGVVVAIGENDTRARIFQELKKNKKQIVKAIHPSAVIASDVQLGEGVMICAGVIVNTGTIIGDNVILNTGCTVDHHNQIGNHVHLAPGVHLGGNVTIGDGTLVGIGSTVIPGRRIGEWSIIGAGSVVTNDIPPNTTAVGVPARVIKEREPGWHLK